MRAGRATTDGRTKAVGWRKAALASGRRRRVEFMVGSAGVSALLQRSNRYDEVRWEELTHWMVVSRPVEMESDG
jgi:hypothetical protein